MEPPNNKLLKRMLFFAIFVGFSFGCLYIVVLQHYFTKIPRLDLEILQKIEIMKNMLRWNTTHIVGDTKISENIKELIFGREIIEIKGKEDVLKTKSNEWKNMKSSEMKKSTDGPKMVKDEREEKLVKKPEAEKPTNIKDKKLENNIKVKRKTCDLGNSTLGPIFVDSSPADMLALKNGELNFVENGGQWAPKDCIPRAELAVIVPYRNREKHLGIFLRHMHKFLKAQMIRYRIFVIEQDDDFTFNRGKLMNVGFKEALARYPFSCFVFHDIDLIPEDGRNDYACPHSPRHMSVAVDKFNYQLLYDELFGGVEMFTKDDYQAVNGFSNSFWGWGGEDDNLFFRVKKIIGKFTRPSMKFGRYQMLKHVSMEGLRPPERMDQLKASKNTELISKDGLSSLQYKIIRELDLPLFTLLKVNLQMHKDRLFGIKEYF